MGQSRRQRRALERSFGLNKKASNYFTKEASDLREKKRRAGEEIHRQNLEKARNSKNSDVSASNEPSGDNGVSLTLPDENKEK